MSFPYFYKIRKKERGRFSGTFLATYMIYDRLWAEMNHQQESQPVDKGSLRLVKEGEGRNQGQNPQVLERYAMAGCRETKRPSTNKMPKLEPPAMTKSIPSHKCAETLIQHVKGARYRANRVEDKVKSN